MGQDIIDNGASGEIIRGKLNSMLSKSVGLYPAGKTSYVADDTFDPEFIVHATCFVHHEASENLIISPYQPIQWFPAGPNRNVSNTFFESITTENPEGLSINFPLVKSYVSMNFTPDEACSPALAFFGLHALSYEKMVLTIYQIDPIVCYLQGTAGNWTIPGDNSGANQFDFGLNYTSWIDNDILGFSVSLTTSGFYGSQANINYDACLVQYEGPNNWTAVGSGAWGPYYKTVYLRDNATGALVPKTSITSSDRIKIVTNLTRRRTVNFTTWVPENYWLSGFSSTSLDAVFEAYIVAKRINDSEVIIRWQPYAGSTTHRIYRDSTLIYEGTDFSFVDTGLSLNTLYEYKMYTLSGETESYITKFKYVAR